MSFGVKRYGTTDSEKQAQSSSKCRQIVKEVMDFGVSQEEILKIVELLALELENRDQMSQLSDLITRLKSGDTSRSTLITRV